MALADAGAHKGVLLGIPVLTVPRDAPPAQRTYNFIEVCGWFAARCDLILLLFDPAKLDISDEMKQARTPFNPRLAYCFWSQAQRHPTPTLAPYCFVPPQRGASQCPFCRCPKFNLSLHKSCAHAPNQLPSFAKGSGAMPASRKQLASGRLPGRPPPLPPLAGAC